MLWLARQLRSLGGSLGINAEKIGFEAITTGKKPPVPLDIRRLTKKNEDIHCLNFVQ